jgi:hypothetical protein
MARGGLLNSGTNTSFNAFVDTILYHHNTAFPLKTVNRSNIKKNKCITQGINYSPKE